MKTKVVKTVTVFLISSMPISGVIFQGVDGKPIMGGPFTPFRPFPNEAMRINFVAPELADREKAKQ